MSPTQDTRPAQGPASATGPVPVGRRERMAAALTLAGFLAILLNLGVCLACGTVLSAFALWGVALMLGGVLALEIPAEPDDQPIAPAEMMSGDAA